MSVGEWMCEYWRYMALRLRMNMLWASVISVATLIVSGEYLRCKKSALGILLLSKGKWTIFEMCVDGVEKE